MQQINSFYLGGLTLFTELSEIKVSLLAKLT